MNRFSWLLPGLAALVLLPGCAPSPQAPAPAPIGVAAAAARRDAAVAAPRVVPAGVATALDEARGVPRFLRATTRQAAPAGASAEEAARAHLVRHAPAYRVAPVDLDHAEVQAVHDPGRGGVIVAFRQRFAGVEVYRGEIKVLMRRNLELVAVTGTPLAAPAAVPPFARPPRAALADALGAHLGVAVAADDVVPLGPAPGGYERLDLARPAPAPGGAVHLARPARVKPLLYAERGALRPAHFVEIVAARGRAPLEGFRYVVADDDGRVLERRDLTVSAHRYRVWVDATGRPLDGPHADFSPHPTGLPDKSAPDLIPADLVTQEPFNHNPAGQADPWLAAGATETRGNNVDAFADLQAPDGFNAGDLRATATSADTFDWTYDSALGPLANSSQSMASVTQLFYTINWLHDWWYDSGFDEAAGNAQQSNYGRGGLANDRMIAHAQDYGGVDNAFMSTLADGDSPVMQIFLWTGPGGQRALHLTPPDADVPTGVAGFGPKTFDLTGTVALVNDGAAPTTDACGPIVNDVAGTIALLDRGVCTFQEKAESAQAAGAIGVILANNSGTEPIEMPGSSSGSVTIPVMSVSLPDGNSLKAALQQGAVSARLFRVAGIDRDAALDSTVTAHEWAHYMHHRLADCGQDSGQCNAMSEGWGDFVAVHLILREGDDLDGTYASAVYSAAGLEADSGYYGDRRAPYSVDFAKNPLTFRHIMDGEPLPTTAPLQDVGVSNAEVHSAGEVWAEMLFEAYVALLKQSQGPDATRTFDEAQRTMGDYVVASLIATPADATYLEGRDALLAVAGAASADDQALIAEAFARRGAGSCAEAPPRDSWDFAGVVESYEVKPRLVLGTPTLDDSLVSCDGNGRLDAGETGRLTVELTNASIRPLGSATLAVSAGDPAVTFPSGASVTVGPMAPFGSTSVVVEVKLDVRASALPRLAFDLSVESSEACNSPATQATSFRVNYEEQPGATATDDVEASTTTWTPAGDGAEQAWARVEAESGNHVWHGVDLGTRTDSWIESPPLAVSAAGGFVVSFRHRYEFEAADEDGDLVYYDGAVVEVSTDGGSTWEDVATWADPGYGGVITDVSGNPLANRPGFVATNPAWPELEPVRIDLGATFAGQTVLLRFRIGTDMAAGAAGWDLDDIAFAGIDNTPFTRVANRPTACDVPPEDGGAGDGGTDPGHPIATCGGCAAGQSPRGAVLLGVLAMIGILAARRRRGRSR